jgi:hypothetical protein
MTMLRLYIDEVGHHDLKTSDDPNERYLGLTGVIMEIGYAEEEFTNRLDALKPEVFGRVDFVLHRRDIIDKKREPFTALRDENLRQQFDEKLLGLINDSTYHCITAHIDKKEHRERYVVWQFQPYHYCMTVMLERYVQFLERKDVVGDVMLESRGKKENKQLAKSYRRIVEKGTDHVPSVLFEKRLTSKEIKLKPKADNTAGLQLADLIASPACRYLVCVRQKEKMRAPFGVAIVKILYGEKYLRCPWGDRRVTGWGTKRLP